MAIRSELRHTLAWCLRQEEFTVPEAAEVIGTTRQSIRRQFMYFIAHGVMQRSERQFKYGREFVYRVTDAAKATEMATTLPKPRSPAVSSGRSSKTHIPKINSVFSLGSL